MQTNDVYLSQLVTRIGHRLNEYLFWGLVLQALWATYKSIQLIFVQIPTTEQKLLARTITQQDVNLLVNDAILVTISSIISILLASWFAKARSQRAHAIQTLIGLAAIILNIWLWNYLKDQNSAILVQPLVEYFL